MTVFYGLERAPVAHFERLTCGFDVGLGQRAQLQGFACGVHKVVEGPDLLEPAFDLGFIGEIDRLSLSARWQLRKRCGHALGVARCDDDLGALVRCRQCGREADTGRSAGDHDAFVFQAHRDALFGGG